jgi:hypothetical protein
MRLLSKTKIKGIKSHYVCVVRIDDVIIRVKYLIKSGRVIEDTYYPLNENDLKAIESFLNDQLQ